MKYLLLGDSRQRLYVEDERCVSFCFDTKEEKWVSGGFDLLDARVGFDPFEPEDSIYRIGNLSCMEKIVEISKQEAEQFIHRKIDESELERLFSSVPEWVNHSIFVS